jgi:signal transduction histidine kinase
MNGLIVSWSKRPWIGWVSIGAVLSVVALAWLGYRAIAEWQRSAELVAQRSADAGADLLFTAATHDMRGVQTTVLSTLRFDDDDPDAPIDLNVLASAFARYPYPEAFFAARMRDDLGPITFYSRADRPPAWLPGIRSDTAFPVVAFPVVTLEQTPLGDRLLERIAVDMRARKPLSAFTRSLNGAMCQVVAVVAYADNAKTRVAGVVGFVVNLDWVRRSYFQDLTTQIGQIRGSDPGLRLAVMDAAGVVRAGVSAADTRPPSSSRRFPLLFLDPTMIDLDRPVDLSTEWWVASASITGEHELMAARTGARVTLMMASMSALVLAGGLGLSARAVRARSRLTDMRSDFVAAVTHELKTPTATIRAISESLLRRASVDDSTRREYSEIVLHEAKRLTRLIDNLLAYARISDTTDAYTFKPTSLRPLVQNSLKEFRFRLDSDQFEQSLELPSRLPRVRADSAALSLAVGNLIDNAIRYSDDRRQLAVTARVVGREVVLEVADAGVGIPPSEIEQVTQKFFRGSGTVSGGSGLGLAIAQRIVSDHSGTLSVRSTLGVGTTVTLTLPIAEDTDDTHIDC